MSFNDLQKALQISQARFLALFNHLPTMAVTLDRDGRMIMINEACIEQLGYSREELAGQSVLNLFHQADRDAVLEKLQSCLANEGQVYYWQFRKVTKEGVLLWVEEVAQAVHDLNGDSNVLVVCQDVSEQKKLKTEIEEAKRYAEVIVETLIEPLVVLNSELIILSANNSFYETFKLSRQKTIGTRIYDLAEGNWDIPPLHLLLEEILSEKGVINGFELEHEYPGIGFRTIIINARRISREETGQHIILLAMEDITERKRAEEESERDRILLEEAEKLAKVGAWECDLLQNRFRMSREWQRIHGSSDPNPGWDDLILIAHPDDREAVEHAFRDSKEKGISYQMSHRIVRPSDGVERIIQAYGHVVKDGNGKPIFIYGAAQDITENKQAEEEIKRLNRELTERAGELQAANIELETFNHTVAHDLSQPLDLLSSYCQMLDRLCGKQLDDECLRYVHDAYNVTLQMNKLIRALLEFSLMSRLDLHRNRVDLSLMAREVSVSLQAAEPQRNVEFLIQEEVVADCDSNLMRVVLNNLIGNAWKYTAIKEKAIIEFGSETLDDTMVYFVKDNGFGFRMSDADKLFAPFRRLPGSEQTKGFGIGLATVERIIRRHGGKVWAEGEPGKGACIRFTLPSPAAQTGL